MSTVTPIPQNTIIRFYEDVGWDNSYQDIRWFTSESERTNYFADKLVGQETTCSIVRMGSKIRVTGRINNFINVDYLWFKNVGMGVVDKEFWCFVTSVDYVNVNTVELSFEVDWVQSYLFNFEIRACLVEREHVLDDTIGKHVLPENISLGEYTIIEQKNVSYEPCAFVWHVDNESTAAVKGNVYTCAKLTSFTLSQTTEFQALLENYADAPERIITVTMGVEPMRQNAIWNDDIQFGMSYYFQDGSNTYLPDNNKLRCAPYILITLDNFQGQVEEFQPELFANAPVLQFRVNGAINPKPAMMCFPYHYKSSQATSVATAQQFCVGYDNFPECAYITDAFRAWVSQYGRSHLINQAATMGQTAFSMLGSFLGGLGGLSKGNVGGMAQAVGNMGSTALSALQSQNNFIQDVEDHKIHGKNVNEGTNQGGLGFAHNRVGFRITELGIKPYDAERIDRYFNRYGYRVDTYKVPNLTGRQLCNYVKTRGAIVDGRIPVDARRTLEEAMNNGCTFWHTDAVGIPFDHNPIVR